MKWGILSIAGANRDQIKASILTRLVDVIAGESPSHRNKARLRKNQHLNYFAEYFSEGEGTRAQTLIYEDNYYSHSFVSDYSSYYSLSHIALPKECLRIHFFKTKWTKQEFLRLVTSPKAHKRINAAYLGHLVIKPIGSSLIGASLIKPYNENQSRKYPSTTEYCCNLFGVPLTLNTLVYQQQDGAVSACATTAIWMALHRTYKEFRKNLPTPNEITVSAGVGSRMGRLFPNSGLDFKQIIKAIHSTGLVSELRNEYSVIQPVLSDSSIDYGKFISPLYVKRFTYAYNSSGLPVLIAYRFRDEMHLVTATGFRFADDRPEVRAVDVSGNDCYTTADFLARIFVHDDQIGPFTRLGFTDKNPNALTTFQERRLVYCTGLIVPLSPIIRVNFDDVYKCVTKTHNIFFSNRRIGYSPFIWDIRLVKSNDYKQQIHKLSCPAKEKARIHFDSMPKYIWVASLVLKTAATSSMLDLLFDSSSHGSRLEPMSTLWHDSNIKEWMKWVLNTLKGIRGQPLDQWDLLECFKNHLNA